MNLEPESITTTSVSGFSSFPSTSGPVVVVAVSTTERPTYIPPFASFSKEKIHQNINHDQTSSKTLAVISSTTTERIPEKMAKSKSSPTTSIHESPLLSNGSFPPLAQLFFKFSLSLSFQIFSLFHHPCDSYYIMFSTQL